MNNVICEKCYVANGWTRSCNCSEGPLRTDPENSFGVRWPLLDGHMGRNESNALTTPRPEATAVAPLEWTARRSSDGLRVVIDSADFEHDATLVLTGDFESEAQKLWFAGAIADKLNRTAVAPVAGEVKS